MTEDINIIATQVELRNDKCRICIVHQVVGNKVLALSAVLIFMEIKEAGTDSIGYEALPDSHDHLWVFLSRREMRAETMKTVELGVCANTVCQLYFSLTLLW